MSEWIDTVNGFNLPGVLFQKGVFLSQNVLGCCFFRDVLIFSISCVPFKSNG